MKLTPLYILNHLAAGFHQFSNLHVVALLYLCSCCSVAVSALYLFLLVPRVILWSVIVAFPDHAHLDFE